MESGMGVIRHDSRRIAALSGVDVARCLVILMLAPAVTVVGSEVRVARASSP